MCYDIRFLTKNKIDYAKRYSITEEGIPALMQQLESITPRYYTTALDHPNVPVITNEHPEDISLYSWGLIPSWVKNSNEAIKLSNQTFNAPGEIIFDKPAFKEPARNKRCLILLDGFYVHHYIDKLAFPYHVQLRNELPFSVAGLWDEWVDRDSGQIKRTVSLVTTTANELLAKISNDPKSESGPRMPVILTPETERDWLVSMEKKADREFLLSLCKPYPAKELLAHTVARLKGKQAAGNTSRAIEKIEYQEFTLVI
jgi:putative SOS response-associated peptidase YedK